MRVLVRNIENLTFFQDFHFTVIQVGTPDYKLPINLAVIVVPGSPVIKES